MVKFLTKYCVRCESVPAVLRDIITILFLLTVSVLCSELCCGVLIFFKNLSEGG